MNDGSTDHSRHELTIAKEVKNIMIYNQDNQGALQVETFGLAAMSDDVEAFMF